MENIFVKMGDLEHWNNSVDQGVKASVEFRGFDGVVQTANVTIHLPQQLHVTPVVVSGLSKAIATSVLKAIMSES